MVAKVLLSKSADVISWFKQIMLLLLGVLCSCYLAKIKLIPSIIEILIPSHGMGLSVCYRLPIVVWSMN